MSQEMHKKEAKLKVATQHEKQDTHGGSQRESHKVMKGMHGKNTMKHPVEAILAEADIAINGKNPWDIQIHDKSVLDDVLKRQSIGAGESYMAGLWDCEKLDEFFFRLCRMKLEHKFASKPKLIFTMLKNSIFNQQSRARAAQVAETHYNLTNLLYERMLGKSMAYTCSYWKNVDNLDAAQFAKYDLVCRKMMLKPGERVLEIGCGWGGLAKFMAEKYGAEVHAMDIGKGPANYAKEFCKDLPVNIYECDYRDIDIYNPKKIKFDKIVSVGVLEHVGYKNYDTLLQISRDFIKDDGIFLLHSICGNVSINFCDPWINKHIFPNGMLPSMKQIGSAFENKFIVEDLQNLGVYYDNTLQAWNDNLNHHWPELSTYFDERFHRMMNYYLLSCAGCFRARGMQLWQFVLTPSPGRLNGYETVR